MRRLLLDARWLSTGLGTYTMNLIRELSEQSDIQAELLTLPRYRDSLSRYKLPVNVMDVPIYSLREQFQIAWAARSFDVLHVPHYNAALLHKGSLLVTIHDLNHILDCTYRRTIKSWAYARPMLRLVAARADHIFTVSEYSKCKIVEHLNVNSERVDVVYNAIGPHIFPEPHEVALSRVNQDFCFEGPYVLFVGNLKPSKNISGLVKAFAVLKGRSGVPHRLLVIGDDEVGRPELMNLARQLGVDHAVVSVPQVSDEQIRFAYSGAELTVVPSFEEGFGLPVVESMACGTPVACARAASLPEVAGPAAEYFDPYEIESIAGSVQNVLLSSDRSRELRDLGKERAQIFTRGNCTQRHLAVYRKFLELPDLKPRENPVEAHKSE